MTRIGRKIVLVGVTALLVAGGGTAAAVLMSAASRPRPGSARRAGAGDHPRFRP